MSYSSMLILLSYGFSYGNESLNYSATGLGVLEPGKAGVLTVLSCDYSGVR
jgi:hypothetical protein